MAEPGEAAQAEQPQNGFNWKYMLLQIVAFQLIMRFFGPNRNAKPATDPVTGQIIPPLINSFQLDSEYDLFFHISPFRPDSFDDLRYRNISGVRQILEIPDLKYKPSSRGQHDLTANVTYTPPTDVFEKLISGVAKDETSSTDNDDLQFLYLTGAAVPHSLYEYRHDAEIFQSELKANSSKYIAFGVLPLVQYMELFSNDDELQSLMDMPSESAANKKEKQKIAHWKTKIDSRLIFDNSAHTPSTMAQPPLARHLRTIPEESAYLPIMYLTDIWILEKDFMPLNSTLIEKPLPLTLSSNTLTQWWFMLYFQLDQLWNPETPSQNPFSLQSHTRKDSFMLKRIILDTNPFFLGFSACFILLHTVFSFLAFKNDIHFWHSNDSMEGLSALSILASFICEIIIGLYLLDSQDTSKLILLEIAAGIAISGWKLTKAIKISLSLSFPFISLSDAKHYKESDTKKYDATAIKFMSALMLPLTIGYAVYSLYYKKYRSWYSYIVSVLAGTVYTFGFVMMTPQLYINYKLQSVDHLPWRALMYKALNTFVDDIAAFMIDMPWMHRLACFRDDAIFICYLYQRWAYRVDKTRPSQWVDPKEIERKKAEADRPRIEEVDETENDVDAKVNSAATDEPADEAPETGVRQRQAVASAEID